MRSYTQYMKTDFSVNLYFVDACYPTNQCELKTETQWWYKCYRSIRYSLQCALWQACHSWCLFPKWLLTKFSFSISGTFAAAFDVLWVKEHAHFLRDFKDGEYEVVFWNVRESFPVIIHMSSKQLSRFWAGQSAFLDWHRTPPSCEPGPPRRRYVTITHRSMRMLINSNLQVVVQRMSSFQLDYTIFSTQISPDIIRHSLNWQILPSTCPI